ncbi:hypothetical protein [Protofrankia symbiont of Coriaria ruscifolia]|uniref:hypothetical protein n=1 Tax=Protofrankia symbiont of Coriaria ruscifolia TaxID=1306542 RepID=UPI0013EF7541|nr:hypothetical protein [Protofrankia symbiont of Coriaria ruscifolia]
MSRYQPYRGVHGRRYQVVMKSWRRLRHSEDEAVGHHRSRRRHLLEELRVLDLETADE